jgi:hypothetical protein
MPGSPSSSWAVFGARLTAMLQRADTGVFVAFWLFGEYVSRLPEWQILTLMIFRAYQQRPLCDHPVGSPRPRR